MLRAKGIVVPLKLVSLELFEKKEVVWRNFFIRLSAHKRIQLSRHLRNSLVHSFQSINHYTISSYLKTMPVTNFFKHINKVYTTYILNFTPFIIKIYGSSKCNLVNSEMAKSEIHLGSQNGQNYTSAVSSSSLQIGKLEKNLHNMECLLVFSSVPYI